MKLAIIFIFDRTTRTPGRTAIVSAAKRPISSAFDATLTIEVRSPSRRISKRLPSGASAIVSGRCVTR